MGAQLDEQKAESRLYFSYFCILVWCPSMRHRLCTVHGGSMRTDQEYALKSGDVTFRMSYLWGKKSLPLKRSCYNIPFHNVVGFTKFLNIQTSRNPQEAREYTIYPTV